MIIRRSAERGFADHGWLRSFHTFSFADYWDPTELGFRELQVINEDRIAPDRGFGPHPHSEMEILTYVLEGELEHRDSMGNGSIIRPGEVQRMSAGTGVVHSEGNPSHDRWLHLLQIWILPNVRGLEPSYEQKAFPEAERKGKLRLVASPDGQEGSVTVHQDARLYIGLLGPGDRVRHELGARRHAWVHVATGKAEVDKTPLSAGDALGISEPGNIEIAGEEPGGEVLLFDLA